MCRLPSTKPNHVKKQISNSPHPKPYWSVEGSQRLYQIWSLGWISQCPNGTRSRMEDGLPNEIWLLWIPSHADGTHQLTCHLPTLYERHFPRHGRCFRDCIFGQYPHLLQKYFWTPQPRSTSACPPSETPSLGQTWEIHISLRLGRILGLYCIQPRSLYGPSLVGCHPRLAHPTQHQGSTVLPGICKFLLPLHLDIFRNRYSSHMPNSQRHTFQVGGCHDLIILISDWYLLITYHFWKITLWNHLRTPIFPHIPTHRYTIPLRTSHRHQVIKCCSASMTT